MVNLLNPAYDVSEKDIVKYDGRRIDIINETIVVMLNKPKKLLQQLKIPIIEEL